MTNLSDLKFFVTPTHRCSYLPRQDATTLFADPNQHMNEMIYANLSEMGFRRSGNYVYKPHCQYCSACIPVRLRVKDFRPSKRQKRIIAKNSDLSVRVIEPEFDETHYELYALYISEKHADGDMFPPSKAQYRSFLISNWSNTKFIEFKLADDVVCIAVLDQLASGISAVYTFYNPLLSKRSLGVYAILWQIEYSLTSALDYLYLGYWIKECKKMSYKQEYKPLECFVANRWVESK